MLAEATYVDPTVLLINSAVMLVATSTSVFLGWRPLRDVILRQEEQYGTVLRRSLLLNIKPRTATILTGIGIVFLASITYSLTGSLIGLFLGGGVGVLLPPAVIRSLRRRRLDKLETQLVSGIQTLASGVRAGLNLVQSMELVARDAPVPLRQEFRHMLREYEYGVPLDEAMDNAASRIGSGDFRLLFAALQTHRERGGDLGDTLDRISESIREIQRLEGRVKTLTAQGRATARWLGAMPIVVLVILYFLVDSSGVMMLFIDDLGKVILLAIIVLNILGFLWIKKIVTIDI